MNIEEDSDMTKLIRGEGVSLWLSRGERRLLKFALETFGESLSKFLLSGLGEEEESRIWLFTVLFTDNKGESHCRDIRVAADDLPDIVTRLPRQREPLVMLSLLWLLMGRQQFSSSLFYDQREVLELLGWEDTPTSRLSIDEAIGRYVDMSYQWALSAEEQAEQHLARYRGWARFVTGCGSRDVEEEEGGRIQRVANRVDFAAEFINELGSRSLFGVNWNEVISLKRASRL